MFPRGCVCPESIVCTIKYKNSEPRQLWCFRHTIQVWDLACVVSISVWSQKWKRDKTKKQQLQHNVFGVISNVLFSLHNYFIVVIVIRQRPVRRTQLTQRQLLIADCVCDGLEEVI